MYSLDFAAQVSRLCMNEVLNRGLKERKILRKSEPNSVLLFKVFRKQNCTADDLTHVSIHSVATLMQDTLWCCQERIVPKKVWRVINYETCTLHDLSKFISEKGEMLLIEILDFLVTIMRYKETNQMDAYHLGEAMGKVTLGPADCDPIIAEKAGHFLTRMIIEHSKTMHCERQQQQQNRLPLKLDSDYSWAQTNEIRKKQPPMSKSEAARAKAKSYNRIIRKIHKRNEDWLSHANVALYALMEDCYESEPERYQEPYLSIFSSHLEPSDAILSPILFRLVTAATKATEPVPQDPFGSSYLFGKRPSKASSVESQISIAFDDFVPLLKQPTLMFDPMVLAPSSGNQYHQNNYQHHYRTSNGGSGSASAGKLSSSSVPKSHMKMINSSISHMKLNLRKNKSQAVNHHQNYISGRQHSSSEFSTTTTSSIGPGTITGVGGINEDIMSYDEESGEFPDYHSKASSQKQNQVKSMMKRVMKMGAVSPTKKPTTTAIY